MWHANERGDHVCVINVCIIACIFTRMYNFYVFVIIASGFEVIVHWQQA